MTLINASARALDEPFRGRRKDSDEELKVVSALIAALALAVSAPATAFGVGGPNEAGNSGKFHPNSGPCASDNDHPHCPGPH